jgi:hypothetical protein
MADYSELIDKICEGELTEEEQRLVDTLLLEDNDFVRELEAQRDILGYFEISDKRKHLNEYHDELLQSNDDRKIIPFRKRTWWIAASIIFFLSISTFAFYRLYQPSPGVQTITEKEGEVTIQQFDLDLSIQQYVLDGSKSIKLMGEKGTELHLPAGSFLDAQGKPYLDDYHLELLEVTNAEMIKAMVDIDKSKIKIFPNKLVYINARAITASLSFDLLNAPRFAAFDKDLQKGTLSGGKIVLANLMAKDYPLISITPEMETYLRYSDSKHLLDSIADYYYLEGNAYHLKDRKGMTISEEFIKEVKKFVRRYEANRNFDARVNKARRSWYIHNKQREIVIGHSTHNFRQDQYLTEFGWYGIYY